MKCPECGSPKSHFKKYGSFVRKSDSKKIQRYKCNNCNKLFSSATFSPCYWQKKRRLNPILQKTICSSMSMRRFAKLFQCSRTTVKRKIEFLASQARLNHKHWLDSQASPFKEVQFDDLETFESTKCKPITVTVFVETKGLKILGFKAATIGAKGTLAKIAKKKYGTRPNKSAESRDKLFSELKPYISEQATIASDMHPHYSKPLKKYFPNCEHKTFRGVRSSVTGQGELKKTAYDPLFCINQSLAMIRDNLKRLSRRTWCTTKKIEALEDQLAIYVDFHNQFLKTKKKKTKKNKST